jgi:pimeloyl-ACP methyl ester carboxylesterase
MSLIQADQTLPGTPARPFPLVPSVTHRFLTAGGIRLHVAEAGATGGEPVLLLHGFPEHWYAWRHVLPLLTSEFRLICPDMRGFGWSDAPRDGYRKDELAEDLIALLDALDIGRTRLVGHDWGGFVGFLACMSRPARFVRFIALSITPPWPPAGPPSPLVMLRLSYQLVIAAPSRSCS